jgi:hypothetical protein
MTIYDKPPQEAETMLADLLNECEDFAPLKEAGVTVELSWARGKEDKDGYKPHPLKSRGHQVYGTAKLTNLQGRSLGQKDCVVTVDGDHWDESSQRTNEALLHHELYHFELVVGDDGAVETDDCGRPKLKLRHHDFEFGWFLQTARRYGADSNESQQFKQVCDAAGNLLPLVFTEPPKGDEERASGQAFATDTAALGAAVGKFKKLCRDHDVTVEFAKCGQAERESAKVG